jgi:hypothetical protein
MSDNLSLCKDKDEVCERIKDLLRGVIKDPVAVKHHRGWGYYISVNMDQIKKIGLKLEENDWHLELSFHFGDSQSQSRSFYNSKPVISGVSDDWEIYPNFHVSFMSRNLIRFESEMDNENYIKYWIDKSNMIYQRKRDDVKEFLNSLSKDGVIVYDNEKKKEMENKYFDTKRQTLNICPGFNMISCISLKDAKEKNKNGDLSKIISKKITEGLSIIDGSVENI